MQPLTKIQIKNVFENLEQKKKAREQKPKEKKTRSFDGFFFIQTWFDLRLGISLHFVFFFVLVCLFFFALHEVSFFCCFKKIFGFSFEEFFFTPSSLRAPGLWL